ncbi:MAG: GTPase ObgE [Planctomycetes bacterium]|nr:GTPase ObgE [Planctomycetota bacterium]MBI3845052.1 GTPase ObgE [Planctomycetota bacterium]
MFKDEAVIHVRGGKGGNGIVAFRREKFAPLGGPTGGDGGRGGEVRILAVADQNTLVDLVHRTDWFAQNGGDGGGNNCHGKNGSSLTIRVPVGTIVKDRDRQFVIKDLVHSGDEIVVARGGRGGRGNKFFASAVNRVPRQFERGAPGEERWLALELKLIADVGIVGMPNAGKSTLLSRLSAARPKISDYPFTTIEPQLGILELDRYKTLVIADLPGLIEGAHTGVGLGDKFLRHVERTRVLLHLVDVSPFALVPAAEAWKMVRNEIALHSDKLSKQPEIVVANKADMPGYEEAVVELEAACGQEVILVSAYTGKNLDRLKSVLHDRFFPSDPGTAAPARRTNPNKPISIDQR